MYVELETTTAPGQPHLQVMIVSEGVCFTRRAVSVGGLLWASSLMATVAPSGAQSVAEMLLFSGFDRLSPGIDNKKYRIINNKY